MGNQINQGVLRQWRILRSEVDDVLDAMLLENPHGVVAEARVQFREFAVRCGISPEFEDPTALRARDRLAGNNATSQETQNKRGSDHRRTKQLLHDRLLQA